ncbi:hypothetical protein G3I59_13840 [Amycolatopsis rubida]|uniref:Secreted protein/lipoprotein n=1 Tax=Amycolatopsis rubida TaxID=112413 RepID=A0ABX0BMP8_9PSEU|nr:MULTISPECIES: hypothetical protein [Amycolatopsis]MYW91657.1 hypothetical protein [Amycolatopsis rubida]NEC56641.1 hypothetical protein [Amycolatopsis rubida]
MGIETAGDGEDLVNNFGAGRRQLHVVLAGAAAMLLAGCSGGDAPAPTSPSQLSAPTQPSSAGSSSGPEQRQAVETAYRQFWHSTFHTSDKPESTWHDAVAAVAVDPQLTTALGAMQTQKQAGITVYGDVTARIVSVQINGASAKVVDCQDTSKAGQADAKTGKRKTVGVPRNPVNADLKRDSADGRWKVAQVTFPGGTC